MKAGWPETVAEIAPPRWKIFDIYLEMFDVSPEQLQALRDDGASWLQIQDLLGEHAEFRSMLTDEPTVASLEFWRKQMSIIIRKGRAEKATRRRKPSGKAGEAIERALELGASIRKTLEERELVGSYTCRCGNHPRFGFKSCADCAAKSRAKYRRIESLEATLARPSISVSTGASCSVGRTLDAEDRTDRKGSSL